MLGRSFQSLAHVVFADRTLGNAVLEITKGKAGCMLPSFRVVSETCAEETIKTFANWPDVPIAIAAGELIRHGVHHMHPLSVTSVANASHGRPTLVSCSGLAAMDSFRELQATGCLLIHSAWGSLRTARYRQAIPILGRKYICLRFG